MASVVYDTFTGAANTVISARPPDVGGAWVKTANSLYSVNLCISNAQRCRKDTSGGNPAYFYSNTDPGTDNYTVQAIMTVLSNTDDYSHTNLAARMDAAANNYYWLFWRPVSPNHWELFRTVNGSGTVIASYNVDYQPGSQFPIKLTVGTNTQVANINGVDLLVTSDSGITVRGYGGLQDPGRLKYGSDTAGVHLDNFELVNTAGGVIRVPWHLFTPVAGGA